MTWWVAGMIVCAIVFVVWVVAELIIWGSVVDGFMIGRANKEKPPKHYDS